MGEPDVGKAGAKLERTGELGDGLVEGAGVAVVLTERRVRIGEAIGDDDREAGVIGLPELVRGFEAALRLLVAPERTEEYGPIEVRFDIPWIEGDRPVEGGHRFQRPLDERERQGEEVVDIGIRVSLPDGLAEEEDGAVEIPDGEPLPATSDEVRFPVHGG